MIINKGENACEKYKFIGPPLLNSFMDFKENAIMVGDRFHDMHGAKENGIASIGVLYGYGNREELEQAGADYVAVKPENVVLIIG